MGVFIKMNQNGGSVLVFEFLFHYDKKITESTALTQHGEITHPDNV